MGQSTFIGGIQESTKLFRKPVAIVYWLLTARWAQIAMELVEGQDLAKLARSSRHTQASSIMGTPAYMSPEQAQGKQVDSRTDIYAFGVTLYRMFAGSLPFEGDVETIMAQKLSAEPIHIPDLKEHIPERFRQIVIQTLNKELDKRPTRMDEIVETLKIV
jgi:serine/threonine-protein kinase